MNYHDSTEQPGTIYKGLAIAFLLSLPIWGLIAFAAFAAFC